MHQHFRIRCIFWQSFLICVAFKVFILLTKPANRSTLRTVSTVRQYVPRGTHCVTCRRRLPRTFRCTTASGTDAAAKNAPNKPTTVNHCSVLTSLRGSCASTLCVARGDRRTTQHNAVRHRSVATMRPFGTMTSID
jgi:hypothetical protein